MICKKCGSNLNNNDSFCNICGESINRIEENINENTVLTSSFSDFTQGYTTNYNNDSEPSILVKVILLLLSIAVIVGIVLFIISKSSNKLVCESSQGDITFTYSKDRLTGNTTTSRNGQEITIDMIKANEYVETHGLAEFLEDFKEEFESETGGTCTYKGKIPQKTKPLPNEFEHIIVGDEQYGYIEIPDDWTKYDEEDTDLLQYTYVGIYYVAMDYTEKGEYTAEDYANNYLETAKEKYGENAVGAIVTLGKNKDINAYEISIYYEENDTYLLTYYFEPGDNKIHYLALEGPTTKYGIKLSDYLFIPESYSLTK